MDRVLECPGTLPALRMSMGAVRAGGTVRRADAPQYPEVPPAFREFTWNVTLTGGVTPVHAYIEELLPDMVEGRIEPGRVFGRTVGPDDVPTADAGMFGGDGRSADLAVEYRAACPMAGRFTVPSGLLPPWGIPRSR